MFAMTHHRPSPHPLNHATLPLLKLKTLLIPMTSSLSSSVISTVRNFRNPLLHIRPQSESSSSRGIGFLGHHHHRHSQLTTWRCSSGASVARAGSDGSPPPNRFPALSRHWHPRPLSPLSLRFQVLHPPPRLLCLLQLRPHNSMTSPEAQHSSDPSPSKTVRVAIKGRVQGVFYRNWTIENATQLGLKGWVRNRRDGSVEALFSGRPEAVDEMEQRCRRGPPDAMVTGLQVFPCSDNPGTGFERRPTV